MEKGGSCPAVWVGCQQGSKTNPKTRRGLDWKHFLEVVYNVHRQEKGVTGREVTCEAVLVILEGGSELDHNL